MDRIKEVWNDFRSWLTEEIEYTNGDALLMFTLLLGVIFK